MKYAEPGICVLEWVSDCVVCGFAVIRIGSQVVEFNREIIVQVCVLGPAGLKKK